MSEGVWVTVEAERILYVDDGRELILCDRLPSQGTLVLRLSQDQLAALPSPPTSNTKEG